MKCPHCDKSISTVQIGKMTGGISGQRWQCVGYSCPLCQKLISVQIDPIAVKTDILNGVAELLGKPKP